MRPGRTPTPACRGRRFLCAIGCSAPCPVPLNAWVLEWLAIHRTELVDNRIPAQQRKPLQPIEPID